MLGGEGDFIVRRRRKGLLGGVVGWEMLSDCFSVIVLVLFLPDEG